MLWREGADTQVLEMFYRVVVQAVMIFRSESWVLSADTEGTTEGVHKGFLKHITGNLAQRNPDGTWVMPETGVVLETAGIQ